MDFVSYNKGSPTVIITLASEFNYIFVSGNKFLTKIDIYKYEVASNNPLESLVNDLIFINGT